MKFIRTIPLLTFVLIALPIFGQSNENHKIMETNSIKLTIKGGKTFTATLPQTL